MHTMHSNTTSFSKLSTIWRPPPSPAIIVLRNLESLPGQPVSRAGHQVEQLWHRVHEVGDLRQEEEQHRLAEVAQDADHRERHTREVAEGVADECF